ncbi:multidrug MFS transporter [Lactobacillus nasalidis]|uniref:Multidrug MFS transporter n=2 Tax=Lactobacillus nasalidis TaxID=2797258 RepID=A0ABQ3W3C7_9LACO|nr:multidrug MFS transporter [Lactobacillus nasalidis]GHW00903.1 multidrug MFS transporter [Lactobacillus nasalidis]
MPADPVYLPVLVGAVKNYKPGIAYQRDDEGENISAKNPFYNELTGIYWAWKNLKDVDAVGLVHYRRYFYVKKPFTLENVAKEADYVKLLEKHDVILPTKRNYYIESNYDHYVHAHPAEPLDKTREILAKDYPDYLPAFDMMMKRRSAHMFNMFVMKKAQFDAYCEFIFGVLNKLEAQIDISGYSVQDQRVYGYISERLMDVWLYTTKPDYTEMTWGQLGGEKKLTKGINLIKRKLGIGKKQTHF